MYHFSRILLFCFLELLVSILLCFNFNSRFAFLFHTMIIPCYYFIWLFFLVASKVHLDLRHFSLSIAIICQIIRRPIIFCFPTKSYFRIFVLSFLNNHLTITHFIWRKLHFIYQSNGSKTIAHRKHWSLAISQSFPKC